MDSGALAYYGSELENIKKNGLWKMEGILSGPQSNRINLAGRENMLNMCSNNYLGLSNHPEVINAAKEGLDKWGFGLSSVRFICGTQEIHKQLEVKISEFLQTDDTILYSSCFDANGGVFEVLLNEQDAVISDELNHASIIDGIRLCKAQRFKYKNNDMGDLENKLKEARNSRYKIIATDGVFSMDGIIANLKDICDLADCHNALVLVDDSHAVGFMGKTGRGTHEYCNVMGRVDMITGTLGKALGGASGGYISGRREIVSLLRQRSRPYLFSNTLAPSVAAASLKVLELLSGSISLRDRLFENTVYYRERMIKAGFQISSGIHPIVPILIGDALLTQTISKSMIERGVYVVGFFHPVVPLGKARIRTQISAAHSREDLNFAINAFIDVKNEIMGLP
ncbi:MAG: glycine C-acetyltransferase [Ruminiclostridium sp.]|nr:glycine C-acetyltransferase [Ruminiclostridium sp.]